MAGTARHGEERRGEDCNGSVRQAQLEELRRIERDHGGTIYPTDVVAFARNPKTALHSAFLWNDTAAAEQYRLEQARRLLRVIVEHTPHTAEPIRAFVALKSERYVDGGYRHMPTLMRSEEGRAAVLETALWELDAFRQKYRAIKELAVVFEAIGTAIAKHGGPRR